MATSVQPKLFVSEGEISAGAVELFPAVWNAAQELVSPSLGERQQAVSELERLGAVRLSPLIAYLVATRLDEPDDDLRIRIVKVLAEVLSADPLGRPAPDEVRSHLMSYFSGLRQETIISILNVCVKKPDLRKRIAQMFNLCPGAGKMLGNILVDRDMSLEIRREAIDMIGLVGFVEAAPSVERLRNRLEARQGVQRGMPFAPAPEADEAQLLPALNTALIFLKSK